MRITTHHFDRLLLARQLQWLGQQAELAADGYEALNLWQKQAFDIIITDCNMPNLNGYQLTRILRESEEEQGRKRAWIIGFTASAMHEVMQLCLEAGMNSCLFKPCSINGLTRALHQSSNGFISATQEADEQAQPEVSDLMDVYMLELMVTTLKEDLAMITQLTLREHRVEVAELAHRIAGSVRCARQNALADACLCLETQCRDEAVCVDTLEPFFEALLLRLENYLIRLQEVKKLAEVAEKRD